MNLYDKYDDWKEEINSNLPSIPKVITEEWLKEQLLNRKSLFRNWGFCFSDLSECVFEKNIDYKVIRKIPFSTKTIFPKEHPFHYDENIYYTFDNIRRLHEQGIDGSGVNVAVIDFSFDKVPNELKDSLKGYINCTQNRKVHFHGTSVSTQLCGKNLGVAPKANLYFFGIGEGRNNIIPDSIDALKKIYEMNLIGSNIKIVNISSSVGRENPEFNDIYNKLLEQGCYVIDSIIFSENFTSANQDPNTKELYYSDWQYQNTNVFDKIAIPTSGKMTPLVTTEDEYLYYGQATYSWSIPMLSGYYALALQVNPNLSFDEFVELAKDNIKIQDNIKVLDIEDMIKKLSNNSKKI